MKFGKLTIIEQVLPKEKGYSVWKTKCDCGAYKNVKSGHLLRGNVKSCGCWHVKHGHTAKGVYSSEYNTWISMRDRCNNPNNKSFSRYGGRGIRVCEDWNNSFETFISDMGLKPTPKHSIDREDNSKGYSKENCKWRTPTEQARNTRRSVLILNVRTGVYYDSISEAAETTEMRPAVFNGKIARGTHKSFIKA